jgi:hypothetical protein
MRPFADFSNQTSTLLLPAWAFVFFDRSWKFFYLVDGKRERWKREQSEMMFNGRRRNSPLRADLFLARASFVFLLEIACSICEWHLF